MTKHLFCLAFLLFSMGLNAQMTFTFSKSDVKTSTDADGVTRYTAPAGTNLAGLITGVKVGDTTIPASQVSPNPTTTKIYADRLEVFTYNNKAYAFRFDTDDYFTAVFISDTHTAQSDHDGTSTEALTSISQNIVAMGQDGTQKVKFDAKPNYVPKADIVFCLGDCDADKDDHTNFLAATSAVFKNADNPIPFVFIAGNHDLSPDYWTGDNPDYGVTSGNSGGAAADKNTISVIQSNINYWNSAGAFDSDGALEFFTDGNYNFQPRHFTFKFKGVRFYCANNYWFQKSYNGSYTVILGFQTSSATYYAPDGIISALDDFVESHRTEASVWMQHYPFVAGSDCNRWWLDQNDKGFYIPASGTSDYGCCDSNIPQNDNTYALKKKNPLVDIMAKTKNAVHFSGHVHTYAVNTFTNTLGTGSSIVDYTVSANGNTSQSNNAYVVLMKRGVGVVEVKQTQF